MARTIPPARRTSREAARQTSRRPVVVLTLALLTAISAMLTSPALAVDTEDDFGDFRADDFVNVAEDLENGTCTPDEVAAEQLTTCRFDLVGNAASIEAFADLHAELDGFEGFYRSSRCTIVDRTLVCPDLPAPFELGSYEVTIDGLLDRAPLATLSIDRTVDGVLGLSLTFRRVPVVFAGVETTIPTFRSFALDDEEEAELLLRRDGDDEIVDRIPALASGATDGAGLVTIPEPGRWTLTGCVSEPDGSCRVEGIRRAIHAIDPEPLPLLPDHNGPAEDRINLVFVGSGFGADDGFVEVVTSLLGLDGEPDSIGAEGREVAGDDIFALDWGPFAVEPLRDHVERFNLWYLADDLPGGPITVSPQSDFPGQIAVEDLGLGSAVSIVNVSRNGRVEGYRANAELASFADDEVLPERDDVEFGSIYLPYDVLSVGLATTLTHELGHALFGLRDEYAEPGVSLPLHGLPNCATTAEEAEARWGDQIGELDPMFERWRAAMEEVDLWFEETTTADEFTVGLVTGGCFGPLEGTDAVRPTERSLMNGEEPVFGAVNRARVQAVLDLFPDPPPPPPTTTTSRPAGTEPPEADRPGEERDDPDTEAQLASQPVDGGLGNATIVTVVGAAFTIAALTAVLVLRRRRAASG